MAVELPIVVQATAETVGVFDVESFMAQDIYNHDHRDLREEFITQPPSEASQC